MRLCNAVTGGLIILVVMGFGSGASSRTQEAGAEATTRVIDLDRGRPVADALAILRQRYYLAITYEDPAYICDCDLADLTSLRDAHLGRTGGPKLIGPQRRKLHFEYVEVNGKPQEDITSLIHRMLSEHAGQGGPVFDVRERTTAKGTEWNVIALKARDSSGTFTDEPDILGASIYMPKARRSEPAFLDELTRQLTTGTGHQVVASYFVAGAVNTVDIGAENIPARDLLANLYGTGKVWDLNYDPEGVGKYILNLEMTPRPPITLNMYTVPPGAPRAPSVRSGSGYTPPAVTLRWMATLQGRTALQTKLVQAGYYSGTPSGNWDLQTVEALKKFQAANNIATSGVPDPETVRRLGLDVAAPQTH